MCDGRRHGIHTPSIAATGGVNAAAAAATAVMAMIGRFEKRATIICKKRPPRQKKIPGLSKGYWQHGDWTSRRAM